MQAIGAATIAFTANQYHSNFTAAGRANALDRKITKTRQLLNDTDSQANELPQDLPDRKEVLESTKGSKSALFAVTSKLRKAEQDMQKASWAQRNIYPWYSGVAEKVDWNDLETRANGVWDDTVVRPNISPP
jgi:hypothetical protein